MKTVNSIKDLEKEIQKRIAQAMKSEVAPLSRKVMKEKIEEEVYSVYTPKLYERRGENGGLLDDENIVTEMIDDSTLKVQNIRSDGDRYVAEIVESGHGYEYEFEYAGTPRPFTKETAEHFRDTNEHVYALYKGLKKTGLNVQR